MTVETESREPEPEPEPSPEPMSNEPIEGPSEQAKFSWDAPDPPSVVEPPSSPSVGSLDALAYGAISGLHLSLAQITGWDGWRFTRDDEDAWRALLKPALAGLDPKKWGMVFALIGVAMLEAGRLSGYLKWKKAHSAPPKPAPGAPSPRPTIEPAPSVETPLGIPLQHAEDGL